MSQQRFADSARSADLYALLQVSPTADIEVIEAAYRVLARRYHPDRSRSPEATARMAQINGAWETLRHPGRRAAYDRLRTGEAAAADESRTTRPPAWRPTPSPRGAPSEQPALSVEPGRLALGPLRRGARRTLAAAVTTEPPGIRVETAIASGAAWLSARPALLEGLTKERITVEVRTHRLAPGMHHGAVELRTSWESRLLPVDVVVRPAGLLYSVATLLRPGPAGERRRGGQALLLLAIVVLLGIIGGLAALALGR